MTALYGSRSGEHVARRCTGCKAIYNRRYRQGQPRKPRNLQMYRVKDPATCAFCNLARGNSLGVPVYRYHLGRTVYTDGRKSTARFATLDVCDRCVLEFGRPSPVYMRLHGLTERRWPRERAA